MASEAASGAMRLGTRGSRLARWQADWVAARLRERGHAVEITTIRTEGDASQSGPVATIGSQGVFTKAIQQALVAGEVDLAVHSLKDLPTTLIPGLTIAAIPERAPLADALVSNVADSAAGLPEGARVGTGSFRRRAQLLNRRPDLTLGELRGNVETRLRKLDDGEHDAIVLAEAGLVRLGLADRITRRLPPQEMLPAPGQGALAIECRADDDATHEALTALDHASTRAAVTAERDALARLEGGCLAALGAWGRVDGERLRLSVVVLREDGSRRLDADGSAIYGEHATLGERLADDLLSRGAAELLRAR